MNALRTSLRCCLAYLQASGVLQENPARLIRRARCASPPIRALNSDEQQGLLRALAEEEGAGAQRDRVLFGLMLHAGLRLGSALALQAEDVDLGQGELRIRVAKGDQPSVVILGHQALDLLRPYLKEHSAGPLFRGRNGQAITPRHAQRRFRSWAARAGIHRRASTHSLRHTFAMALYERTGDIALVKQALRHQSTNSTLVYASANDQQLRRALG